MKHRLITSAALLTIAFAPAAWADKNAAIDEMEAYLEFVDYGGGVIFAEQSPKDDWQRFVLIDARILQGGMEKWKAKGGFDAAAKASAPARH